MIKAVVFDLDDTLISEFEYIKSGYKAISEKLSNTYNIERDTVYENLLNSYVKTPKYVFNDFFDLNRISYTDHDINELIHLYRNHTPKVKFFEDVKPTITSLKDRNIRLGIITDGYKESQKQKLEVLRAYDLFDFIIVTDELGRDFWKPHPYSFELMRTTLNVEYNEMMYVGDNPAKDFYISSIFPIETVRIIRENGVHRDKQYLEQIKEKYQLTNLYDLEQILLEQFESDKEKI